MIKSINHIGIAVRDLEPSVELFKKIFGASDFHFETVAEQKVKIASFKIADIIIELTAPTDESSPIHKFIEKKGEGIHHIAFQSDDVASELNRLAQDGVQLINAQPQIGAHEMLIAFLHPKSTNGVLMEICQPQK
jgi:methylmalonyl-CoA epimerase